MKKITKQILFGVIFFSGFLVWQNAEAATIYYVSLSGSDTTGDGTSGSPWRTIQKCASTMAAGDTCSVAAGNYAEKVTISTSGIDNDNRSTFIATEGYATVEYFLTQASHLTIDGFEITQPNSNSSYDPITISRKAIGIGATQITFQNCYIHKGTDYGYLLSEYLSPYPSYVTIKNNIFADHDGIAMLVNGDHWIIEGNTFDNIRSDIAYYGGTNHIVQDNLIKFTHIYKDPHHADYIQNIAGGEAVLKDFTYRRNTHLFGAFVQIGNFNNDLVCAGDRQHFYNNVFYGVTNPFNYAGCHGEFFNNTFVFAGSTIGSNVVSGGVAGSMTAPDQVLKNNLFIGCLGEGLHTLYGVYSSSATDGNNMATLWPSENFGAKTDFNIENDNINGGDPKFKNLPISAYPMEGIPMLGWDNETVRSSAALRNNWGLGSTDPEIPLNGGVFYKSQAEVEAAWTLNSPWAYHNGDGDWTQFYAAHLSDGTGSIVYNNWAPVVGKRYSVMVRGVNSTIAAGSITPSLGGVTGVPCGLGDLMHGGWCPSQYFVATTTEPFTITPSNDFRDGVFQIFVAWEPDETQFALENAIVHSGKNSLHLNFLAGDYVYLGTTNQFGKSFNTMSVWVKLVSGSVKAYIKDGATVANIGTASTPGGWVKLSADVLAGGSSLFVIEALSNGTEVYVDDASAKLKNMTTTTIQYPNAQSAALTVGSNISINGDGVCRTIINKDATNRYVNFSPALSVAAPDWSWIEAWGSKNNCVLDLSINSDSPARGAGTNLSAYFTDDITQATRLSWDIGAYGYEAGVTDTTSPAAPSGLAVN